MPTLKEIKGRISSVKSTLKITSAMKLVSSAKLRKAQSAIEAMRPYEAQLQQMLSRVAGGLAPAVATESAEYVGAEAFEGVASKKVEAKRVIVAIASNSSLCGGFNANAIAKVRSVRQAGDVVYSIGRKMADAMRKDGFPSPKDYTFLAEHPAYGPVAELFEELAEEVEEGRVSEVLLVYNHFVSSARQVPVVERLLPAGDTLGPSGLGMTNECPSGLGMTNECPSGLGMTSEPGRTNPVIPGGTNSVIPSGTNPVIPGGTNPVIPGGTNSVIPSEASVSPDESDIIIEPNKKYLLALLLPKTLKLILYAALLDSVASEHAARTIAMQTATDNGENLLSELTLQYNKGRQQKITAEILDLAGGQSAD